MKALVFAASRRQAEVDIVDNVKPDRRRDILVLTSPRDMERVRGIHEVSAMFLDGWFHNWGPVAANDLLWELHQIYDCEAFWECEESLRRDFARKQFGLGPAHPSHATRTFYRHDVSNVLDYGDRWTRSMVAAKFQRMLEVDAQRAELSGEERRLSALPGLDDKPKGKNPVGGIVFKTLFDMDDPDGAYPLYADWYIRKNIRTPEPYIKEPKRDRDNISAALDRFRGVPSSL